MNTLTKGFARRVLSMLLATIMVFSLGIVGLTTASAANIELAETGAWAGGDYLFYDPHNDWGANDISTAAYFWNSTTNVNKWVYMSFATGDSDIQSVKVPDGTWTHVLFCRMKKGSTATSFNSSDYYNKTNDLTLPSDGNNFYTANSLSWSGEVANLTGSWSYRGVCLSGEFNSWASGVASKMDHTGSGDNYVRTVTLEANKTYEFKVNSYGDWYGNTGTMESDNCTDWTFSTSDGNAKIKTTSAGEYIFTFNTGSHTLTVTYPEVHIPFSAEVIAIAKDTVVEQGEPIIVNTSVIGTPADRGFFVSDLRLYRVTDTGVDGPYGLINDQLQYATTDLALGTYEFYVEADVVADGETKTWTSDRFSATVVEAEADTITISAANVNVYAGQTTTINVTPKLSSNIASNLVTYEFYLGDTKVDTNTKGTYDVETTDADAGTTRTYRIVASTTDSNGAPISAETTVTVTIHSTSGGDGIVTIYFKSAESYGYVPSIKFGADGTYAEMTKAGAVIGHNTTNTGHYWWYSATTTAVDGKVEFSLTSPRFFKDCTYTLDVTKEAPETDGSYEYYFAIDNLNLVSSEVINVTGTSYKNYYNTIIDMVTELTPGELVQTGYTFEYYALGDANNDGKLNIRDTTIIQKDLAQITELSYAGNVVADVTGDGNVTIKDATAIQKQLAGL